MTDILEETMNRETQNLVKLKKPLNDQKLLKSL